MTGQRYISFNDEEELLWDVERLWALSKPLPVERIPLDRFAHEFDRRLWFGPDGITFRASVERVRAVNNADLSFPIILSADGSIMDGRTRLHRALLLGHRDIGAVRFPATPEPDERRPRPKG
jgi:hypothetical protein